LEEYFLIAEIKSVYDDDGFVSITSFSDSPERFFDLEKVFIEVFGNIKQIFVEDVEVVNKKINLKFANFDSYEDASALVGAKIYVDSENVIQLPEDTYFIHDLIGCKVFREDEFFGELVEVITLSSNDVYVVKDSEDNEVLVPAVKDYISKFDIKTKKIFLTPGCDLNYAED